MDDDLFRIIAEVHMVKGDIALDMDLTLIITDIDRFRCIRDFFLLFQEFEDTLRRCGSALQDVHDLGRLGNRLVEVADVGDKRLDIADRQAFVDGQIAAQHTDADIAEVADEVGDRHHDAGHELSLPGTVV